MSNKLATNHAAESTRAGVQLTPRVDIFENEHELWLCAEVPGVAPGGIDLRYERGELTLHGKCQAKARAGQPVMREFEAGDYHRVVQVHEAIDASQIFAEHKLGVLTVHLPKQEAVKPKLVTVKSE